MLMNENEKLRNDAYLLRQDNLILMERMKSNDELAKKAQEEHANEIQMLKAKEEENAKLKTLITSQKD